MPTRAKLALGLALLMGLPVLAVNTKFSNFTPLSSSTGPLPVDRRGSGLGAPITSAVRPYATARRPKKSAASRTAGSSSVNTLVDLTRNCAAARSNIVTFIQNAS